MAQKRRTSVKSDVFNLVLQRKTPRWLAAKIDLLTREGLATQIEGNTWQELQAKLKEGELLIAKYKANGNAIAEAVWIKAEKLFNAYGENSNKKHLGFYRVLKEELRKLFKNQ